MEMLLAGLPLWSPLRSVRASLRRVADLKAKLDKVSHALREFKATSPEVVQHFAAADAMTAALHRDLQK